MWIIANSLLRRGEKQVFLIGTAHISQSSVDEVKLLIENGVSKNHIGVEKKIIVNKLSKRFDVVAFDRNGLVKMLVECKAPSINIDQKVFDQTLIYNKNLNSDYIMITNGIMHFIFKINIQDKSYDFINEFPIIWRLP